MSFQLEKWPKVVLFGDSLTQNSFDPIEGKWGALLAARLQRICDVVCRGFSGYNSNFCRAILPRIFSKENVSDIQAFVIFLGCNDSSGLESEVPLVPLKQFQENLEAMVTYLHAIGISKEKIILMTPPPYSDEKYSKFCEEIGRVKGFRNLATIAEYVSVCVDVANKHDLGVVNIYEEMLKNEAWPDYLLEGLHFGAKGSDVVFNLLWPLIEKRVDVNKMIFPYWRNFDLNNII